MKKFAPIAVTIIGLSLCLVGQRATILKLDKQIEEQKVVAESWKQASERWQSTSARWEQLNQSNFKIAQRLVKQLEDCQQGKDLK